MVTIKVNSSNGKDVWVVDLSKLTCTCPDYRFRRAKSGTLCKHIQKAIESITDEKIDYMKIIQNNDDAVVFVEKYGEEVLDKLKFEGSVYEVRGKLKIMR